MTPLLTLTLHEVHADDPELLAAIVRISDEMLGAGLYDTAALRAAAARPSATLIVATSAPSPATAPRGTDVLGWAYGEELSGDRSWYEEFGARAHAAASADRVASVRELAVAASHQGHGIGRALTEAVLAWARRRGAEHAVTVAWLSPAPRTSAPLFERLGFQRLGVAAAPYEADSRARGWTCRFCGGPCTCQAALYHLALRP